MILSFPPDGVSYSCNFASPLPSKSASIIRATEAGTRKFKIRFTRPGTTFERFLLRPSRASDTHCSTLIGFIGIIFGSRPNLPIKADAGILPIVIATVASQAGAPTIRDLYKEGKNLVEQRREIVRSPAAMLFKHKTTKQ